MDLHLFIFQKEKKTSPVSIIFGCGASQLLNNWQHPNKHAVEMGLMHIFLFRQSVLWGGRIGREEILPNQQQLPSCATSWCQMAGPPHALMNSAQLRNQIAFGGDADALN